MESRVGSPWESALPDACRAALARQSVNGTLDVDIRRVQDDVRARGNALVNLGGGKLEELGWLFVARARASDDSAFYGLARSAADCLESVVPGHHGAMLLDGHVLHNLHRFREAEGVARRLVDERGSSFDFGLLGDVLMELGNVEEAAGAYQTMVDMRPGLQSYSRAAHMRWLVGDVEGAVESMRMAASATSPRDPEAAAWVHARLAVYQLQTGSIETALASSERALEFAPDHSGALLARGRVLLTAGSPDMAVDQLERVVENNPWPEAQWLLAEALTQAGQVSAARDVERALVASGGTRDARTVSLFLSTRREQPEAALDLAEQELSVRADVLTLDAHAWALAGAGRTVEARRQMDRALAVGTADARLFYHAGAIARLNGERDRGCRLLSDAIGIGGTLLPSEAQDVRELLASCGESD